MTDELMKKQALNWQPWEWQTQEGFWLRGQHTQPRGLPILHFIHGNSYCGRIYSSLWDELSQHFDIFLHDAQGHGDSDHGAKFVGWERSAELAEEVWRSFSPRFHTNSGMPEVIGMGHSFGGVLTTYMQAKSPDLFSKLVLLDPIVMPPAMVLFLKVMHGFGIYDKNPHAKRAGRRRSHWPTPEDAWSALHGRGMHRGWTESSMRAFIEHGLKPSDCQTKWQLKCEPSREAEIFSSYLLGIWRMIPKIDVQTHILVGAETYPFVWKSMRRWNKIHPESDIIEINGGHCFMLQHPQETASQVRQLLTRT